MVESVKEEEFDVEAAKKTIKSVLGDDVDEVDEDKITKLIDHFRKLSGAENGDDVLHFLQYAENPTYELIGITDDDRIQRIAIKINKYEANRGGSRKRHTRKYASKHRKSARRGTKQRKSSRSQLRLRRRRTNKK